MGILGLILDPSNPPPGALGDLDVPALPFPRPSAVSTLVDFFSDDLPHEASLKTRRRNCSLFIIRSSDNFFPFFFRCDVTRIKREARLTARTIIRFDC